MPARRCSLCNIQYPAVLRFEECPVCGEGTNYFSNVQEDPDWLDLAQSRAEQWDGDIENLIDWVQSRGEET